MNWLWKSYFFNESLQPRISPIKNFISGLLYLNFSSKHRLSFARKFFQLLRFELDVLRLITCTTENSYLTQDTGDGKNESQNVTSIIKYLKFSQNWKQILTNFSPMFHFYSPWKRHKTFGFLTFSGGIEMEHWSKMLHQFTINKKMKHKFINYSTLIR